VFPETSQIWRNPVFAGFVETVARREVEENGPPWGAEENAFAEVGAVHEYLLTEKGRQLYPVLLALVQWGNALAEEEVQPSIHEHVPCGRQRE
jgi:hypothetical protein